SAQVAGLEGATLSYRWGEGSWTEVGIVGTFSKTFNTTALPNGITTFEVKAETGTQTFTDKVKVNVVNISPHDNWRVLITEVIPDPSAVPDDEGEFIELTNSFPFAILLQDWQVGDDTDLYTFGVDYTINTYSSLIIARSLSGFQAAYGTSADIELDFALTNSGDYAQLIDPNGDYADVVAFGSATAPDNSEVVPKPEAGESLHRATLSVDTNTAADFSLGPPDPKGTVPQDPLRTTPLETSAAVTSAFWIAFFAAIIILPAVRRKWKNRE
ncbi:MAG: lamin tail domain-containing protein, partial [Candidatus Hodarchaeales archaeon]